MSVFERELRALVKEAVREALREEMNGTHPAAGDEYMSVANAAKTADVAAATIRTWIDEERLGRYHAGRLLRVKRSELDRLMRTPPTPRPGNDSRDELTPEEAADLAYARRRRRGPQRP